jgi:hypothetical protein
MSSLYSALEMVDRGSDLLYFTQRVLREPCTDFFVIVISFYCKINIYFDETSRKMEINLKICYFQCYKWLKNQMLLYGKPTANSFKYCI